MRRRARRRSRPNPLAALLDLVVVATLLLVLSLLATGAIAFFGAIP